MIAQGLHAISRTVWWRCTLGECREFRPDDVRIDCGLSDPSPIPAIAAGDYVLSSNQSRVIAYSMSDQLGMLDKIRF